MINSGLSIFNDSACSGIIPVTYIIFVLSKQAATFIGVINAFIRSLKNPCWDHSRGYEDYACQALELVAMLHRLPENN